MHTRPLGLLILVLLLSGISPVTQGEQLVKRMSCKDFFLTAPIDHRNIGNQSKLFTIQVVRGSCRGGPHRNGSPGRK